MASLLVVEASPRGPLSVSRQLSEKFAMDWQRNYPEGRVVTRDLYMSYIPFVDLPWFNAAFTPVDQHTPEMTEALKISDGLIAELIAADEILIATPMYNFSIPAILKAYIDQIVRLDVTFTADYQGLVNNKRTNVIISSGADFSPGAPHEEANVASSYLRQILGFIGITDVNIALAGRTRAIQTGQDTLDSYVERFDTKSLATPTA